MVDGFSCILDFPKVSGDPPYKGNTSIKPSKSSFNNNNNQRQKKKKKKRAGKPSPIKTTNKKFISLGYTETEKRRRALGQDLFCVICNWAV